MRNDSGVLVYVATLVIPCTSKCKSRLPILLPFKYFCLYDMENIDGMIVYPWCQQGSQNLSWNCIYLPGLAMPLRMLTVSPLQRQPHFSARTAIFQKQKIPPSHQVNVRRVKNKVPYSQIGRETMTETLSPPAGDKHHKKVYTHVSNRKSRTSCATCK